ncbi:MAG TPA: thioesterase family protein [Acidimicrobiia bacterium]
MSDRPELAGALFEIDGDVAVPSELTRGRWDPGAMHGGPPAALLARAVEQCDPGPAGFLARLTVELLRPIPLRPLTLSARTLRPGKMVQWIEATLHDGDVEVARAVGLRLRTVSDSLVSVPPLDAFPAPELGKQLDLDPNMLRGVGFWNANEIRMVAGTFGGAGPGGAWIELTVPLVAGEETTAAQRVLAAADFASGIGNPLDMTVAGAINADLTVAMHRPLAGSWVGVDAQAWAQAQGTGMAEAVIHDTVGPVGRSVQSLLVR